MVELDKERKRFMGVSNHSFYRISRHAKSRYHERLNSEATELSIIKDITGMLANSRLLGTAHKQTEAWLHEDRGVVCIIDPKKMVVVTVYNSVRSYNNAKDTVHDEEVVSKVDTEKIHPVVKDMIAEFSKKAYLSQEKNYYSAIAPLFSEYGERMGNLSRMKNPKDYKRKQQEMTATLNIIKELETEKTEVLLGLESFFMHKE